MKPFRDDQLPTLIYRCIKVIYFRPVKDRRFLLGLTQASERPIEEHNDENVSTTNNLEQASVKADFAPPRAAAAGSSE
jgi:hypothetical protein